MADGGAADDGAAAVRRCGERRCGDGDGGAATAVRREAPKLYSLSPLTLLVGPFHGAPCSLLVLQRPRPRLVAPDGKRKSSPYATPAKPVTRNVIVTVTVSTVTITHGLLRQIATSVLARRCWHEPISTQIAETVARINHHQFARLDHVDKSTALPLRTTTPACHCTAAGASGCRCR
jgi:hypothetical protein